MMMMMAVEQAGSAVATALQWLALAAFAILAVACVAVLARERRALAGPAIALLVVALNQVSYYVAFLMFPDWLGPIATMMWSIVGKLNFAGTGLLILWFAWEERHERR